MGNGALAIGRKLPRPSSTLPLREMRRCKLISASGYCGSPGALPCDHEGNVSFSPCGAGVAGSENADGLRASFCLVQVIEFTLFFSRGRGRSGIWAQMRLLGSVYGPSSRHRGERYLWTLMRPCGRRLRRVSIGFGSGPQIGIQKGPPRFAFRTISVRPVGAGWGCGDGASAG